MPMVTRCPSCNTVFRVTPQQLQAHQGEVRCGRCMMVFDGFKGLAMLPEPAPSEPEVPAASPTPVAPQPVLPDQPAAAQPEPVAYHDQGMTESPPESPSEPVAPGFEFEPVSSPAPELVAAQPEPRDRADDLQPKTSPVAARPVAVHEEMRVEEGGVDLARRTRLWAAGSVFLLLALAGQASYLYRVELAANYPALKPVLMKMCEAAGCNVPLPQRPKLVYIEASDMQGIDPARPGVIQLTATLRNHAGYDVAFPALDLVLTNTREHSLARRIFMPGEYLARGRDVKSGIPASAEVTIHLELDTGNLGAAGFRLDLLAVPVT